MASLIMTLLSALSALLQIVGLRPPPSQDDAATPFSALEAVLQLTGLRRPSGQENAATALAAVEAVPKPAGQNPPAGQDGAAPQASPRPSTRSRILDPPRRPPLPVVEVPMGRLKQQALLQAPEGVGPVLKHVIDVAMAAHGACSFAIAQSAAYCNALDTREADLPAMDCCRRWPSGYMTTRIRGANVREQTFADAVHELSKRTPDGLWPIGHEAEGLNKGGFSALVDLDGRCLKALVGIRGVPAAPLQWQGVNCLHCDALDLMCVLRQHGPAAVVMRCAGGVIHVLLPSEDGVVALGTPGRWRRQHSF